MELPPPQITPIIFDYDLLSKKHDEEIILPNKRLGNPNNDVADLAERFMNLTTVISGLGAVRLLQGNGAEPLYNQLVLGVEGKLTPERFSERLNRVKTKYGSSLELKITSDDIGGIERIGI